MKTSIKITNSRQRTLLNQCLIYAYLSLLGIFSVFNCTMASTDVDYSNYTSPLQPLDITVSYSLLNDPIPPRTTIRIINNEIRLAVSRTQYYTGVLMMAINLRNDANFYMIEPATLTYRFGSAGTTRTEAVTSEIGTINIKTIESGETVPHKVIFTY
ncbi:hypothetical protein COTS27_01089 [Spirochaetota bacterium]|nr:hypothetical protein COTS27_01089 [Spirochaetota bacterium]